VSHQHTPLLFFFGRGLLYSIKSYSQLAMTVLDEMAGSGSNQTSGTLFNKEIQLILTGLVGKKRKAAQDLGGESSKKLSSRGMKEAKDFGEYEPDSEYDSNSGPDIDTPSTKKLPAQKDGSFERGDYVEGDDGDEDPGAYVTDRATQESTKSNNPSRHTRKSERSRSRTPVAEVREAYHEKLRLFSKEMNSFCDGEHLPIEGEGKAEIRSAPVQEEADGESSEGESTAASQNSSMVASDISDGYINNERRDQRFLIRVQRGDQADRLVMWDGLSREILLADDVGEEYFEHVREMEEGEEDSDKLINLMNSLICAPRARGKRDRGERLCIADTDPVDADIADHDQLHILKENCHKSTMGSNTTIASILSGSCGGDELQKDFRMELRDAVETFHTLDGDIKSLREFVGIVFLHRWCVPFEEVSDLMQVEDSANLQNVTDFQKKLRKCELFYKLRLIMPLHHFVVFVVGQGGLGDLGNCNDRNQRLQLWEKEIDNERKLHGFHYW
jgi:hypothetical protein